MISGINAYSIVLDDKGHDSIHNSSFDFDLRNAMWPSELHRIFYQAAKSIGKCSALNLDKRKRSAGNLRARRSNCGAEDLHCSEQSLPRVRNGGTIILDLACINIGSQFANHTVNPLSSFAGE